MVAKKSSNGLFIVVVSLIIIVGGGVTYLLYRKSKKVETKKVENIDEVEVIANTEIPNTEIPNTDVSRSRSSSSSNDEINISSNEITPNPFKTEEDLKKFQRWILQYHETDGNWGKGSATPVKKADGDWGEKSAKAWDKYGKRYVEKTQAVVNKPTSKPTSKLTTKPKSPQKVDEDAKLKLGSDNSNVSAIKQIMNQVAFWTGIKSKNGVNFPINTDNKFTKDTDKVVAFFFPKYKTNGYVTRKEARYLWSYTAGLKNKTFPSTLVGNKYESSYKTEYLRGKEKSKKKFSGFHNNGDNFVIDSNYGNNFI